MGAGGTDLIFGARDVLFREVFEDAGDGSVRRLKKPKWVLFEELVDRQLEESWTEDVAVSENGDVVGVLVEAHERWDEPALISQRKIDQARRKWESLIKQGRIKKVKGQLFLCSFWD